MDTLFFSPCFSIFSVHLFATTLIPEYSSFQICNIFFLIIHNFTFELTNQTRIQ